ncbi:HAM1 domain-containing protein [Encephalitozoon cuniculi EcunIII-L]|nr:HAM1 domain-containing protein [Encephalitozoon cuniculi EcunIII-L]
MEDRETVSETRLSRAVYSRENVANACNLDVNKLEMVRTLFITSSSYKYKAFQEFLGAPVQMIRLDIEEIQGSKEEIIIDKLQKVSHLVTESTFVFVDDTSIHMSGLGGFPGQYAKDFLKMGAPRVLEVASKVGGECVYSTIIGMVHMHKGKMVTRTFAGEVHGSIMPRDGVKPEIFSDLFIAEEDEHDEMPHGIAGIKIGRYRAVEKVKRYLAEIGVYDRMFDH